MTSTAWQTDGPHSAITDRDLRGAAVAMLEARRAMRGTLPGHLIHDIALEALIIIYLAEPATVAFDSLLDGIAVPSDLVKRWLAALLSERLADVTDEAVSLTLSGRDVMTNMLTKVVLSQRVLLERDGQWRMPPAAHEEGRQGH